jgi:hypothetical protein
MPVADLGKEPIVRHEFVGMMFAVTIGEVGLQVASLVQAKHYGHFLPFYSHLLLATLVITSSWVGWSLSQAPGARRDVSGVFTWGFVTLLLDVFLVVWYFIMVRTVELGKGGDSPRIESSEKVAGFFVGMFALFFLWDVVTKVFAYTFSNDGPWVRNCGLRMIPTVVCLLLAIVVWRQLKNIDLAHYINADLALLALALLFRSLKDIISAGFPRLVKDAENACRYVPVKQPDRNDVILAVKWSFACFLIMVLGTISAKNSWPLLPSHVVDEINTPLIQEKAGDNADLRSHQAIQVPPRQKINEETAGA